YEAELVRWLVQPGDAVKRGGVLLEVMTDKATMEVPSPFAGTIGELKAAPGQTVKVGQVLLEYTPAGAAVAASAPEAGKPTAVRPALARTTNGAPLPTPLAVRAAPSVRLMAGKLGIDLSGVRGSGPDGRVLVEDLTRSLPGVGPAGNDMPKARRAPGLDV